MAKGYRFHPEAQLEYEDAIRHYFAEAGSEIAAAFIEEIEAAVAKVTAAPDRWRVVSPRGVRRALVGRFPYGVLYRWESEEGLIVIYAAMHLSRRPNYWSDRVG